MINRINRGGKNIKGDASEILNQYNQLDKLNRQNKKLSPSKKILISVAAIAGLAVLPIPVVIYMKDKKRYVTTFIDYNIEEKEDAEVRFNKGAVIADIQVEEIEGYRFDGWYADKDYTQKFPETESISDKSTIYGRYIRVFIVTTVIDGESKPVQVDDGTLIGNVASTDKEGYRFDGWYENDDYTMAIDKDTPVTSNQTIYGRHIEQIKITFKIEGYYDMEIDRDKGITFEELQEGIEIEQKEYKIFDGWYSDNMYTTKVENEYQLNGDTILYGRYIAEEISISIDIDGVVVDTKTIDKGTTFAEFIQTIEVEDEEYYDFDGWYDYAFNKIALEQKLLDNITIYGRYVIQQATITLQIEGETAVSHTVDKTTKLTDIDLESLGLGNRDGYRFSGWFIDSEYKTVWNEQTIFTKDEILYGKYIEQVSITFNVAGEDPIVLDIDKGLSISDIDLNEHNLAERFGYEFSGWFTDDSYTTPWVETTQFIEDDILYGKYSAIINVTLVVENATTGEITSTPVNFVEGVKVSDLPKPAEDETWKFYGWYGNAGYTDKVDDNSLITKGQVLYGRYVQIFTLDLFIDGEKTSFAVEYGTQLGEAIASIETEKEDFQFDGWFTNDSYTTQLQEDYVITSNCEVHAKYTAIYQLVVYQGVDTTKLEVLDGTIISDAIASIETDKEGYRFDGWYTSNSYETSVDLNSEITSDYEIYAKYTAIYTLTVYQVATTTELKVPDGTKISEAIASIETDREGYRFDGWYTSNSYATSVDLNNEIVSNYEIYAKYTQLCDITLVVDGEASNITVDYGTKVSEIEVTDREGYYFTGWCTSNDYTDKYDSEDLLTDGLTLYAGYMPYVSFVLDGATVPSLQVAFKNEQTINDIESINAEYQDLVNRAGYRFVGWFTDNEYKTSWDNDDTFSAPTTLYGYYVQQVNVVVYLNGSQLTSKTLDIGVTVEQVLADVSVTITIPDGHKFDNWYQDDEYTTVWDLTAQIGGDVNIYGRYTAQYTINANIDGETTVLNFEELSWENVLNATGVTDSNSIGWYTDSNFTTMATTITDGMTVYTRMATLEKLSFTVLDDGTYRATSASTSITGEVVIPRMYNDANVTSVYFNDCESITELVMPHTITEIYGIVKCTGLTSLNIPDSVTTISVYGINYCNNITSIFIPKSVVSITHISSSANLESIVVDSENLIYDSRDNCNAIIETKSDWLITGCKNTIIPDDILGIGYDAFGGCTPLTSITIPNSVTTIREAAFQYTGLTSITIPSSVTKLGQGIFNSCFDLTNITFEDDWVWFVTDDQVCWQNMTGGNSINLSDVTQNATLLKETYVDYYWYKAEANLSSDWLAWDSSTSSYYVTKGTSELPTELVIPATYDDGTNGEANVTYIEGGFNVMSGVLYSTNLSSIILTNTITSIVNFAFAGCTTLTSVTIPSSVTSIGFAIFSGCTKLTSVNVEEGNSVYDSRDNCNAVIESSTNILVVGCGNSVIPNSVTKVRNMSFYNCTSLSTINIPSSVRVIEGLAFTFCSGLTEVTIEDGLEQIGDNAFLDCAKLSSIIIPGSVTKIGKNVFQSCDNLTSITVEGNGVWYVTDDEENWNNKTGGTSIDLSDGTQNTTLFKETYVGYYWYKLD